MATVSPLSVALSGLRTAQAQIGVTSNNIANASTDGYTKKTLNQYTVVIGGQGGGVDVGLVERHVNDLLLKDLRRQISLTAGLETTKSYLSQVQSLHGTPESDTSITSSLSNLKTVFSQLANQPESDYLIETVYDAAQQTVKKFSQYTMSITQLRNSAQSEMKQSVDTINLLTSQIADLNKSIKAARAQLRSSADLEDQRDLSIRNLAQQLDISYYANNDGSVTVMTATGDLLAHTEAVPVNFNPSQVGVQSYYPASAAAIILGNPSNGTDLTASASLGGKLGALVTLRDKTLPTYQAQMDELAYQTASRFSAEGMDLFTLPNGTIPNNVPSDYAGFADNMMVNPAVTNNKSLIRSGTDPLTVVQAGSNEVLRKIVEFAFGDVAYQQATAATTITTGPATLFTELGLTGQARVIGNQNVQTLATLADSAFINPGTNDTFTLQVGAGLPQTITITAGMNASGLVGAINAAIPGAAALTSAGQLVLTTSGDLTIGAGTLGAAGLAELGLSAGVTNAESPSFKIGLGNNDPVTVTIDPTDTGTTLLGKLNAITGIDASIVAGKLTIRPENGGDISIADGLKTPLQALGMTLNEVSHTPFNMTGLGPGANLSVSLSGILTLAEYSTQLVGIQSQEAQGVELDLTNETSYRSTLESQLLNEHGVNIDEEMAHLISIQTAYSASARTISVVQQMMDELLNSIR